MKALTILLLCSASIAVPLRAADFFYSNKFDNVVAEMFVPGVRSVQYFDGNILLGSASAPPWKFAWREPRPGAHAIHAIWETTDDRHGAVNPALVVIRGRRNP